MSSKSDYPGHVLIKKKSETQTVGPGPIYVSLG